MTPAQKILSADTRRRFKALVAQPEAAIDLAQAALLIAAEEQPHIDVDHYRAMLFELGVQARERVGARLDAPVGALNHFVFNELGFAGNHSYYYDPRNSLLNEVLERRTGIPITLSLVYMELGRRAGLHVEGVGMPGHFIVRVRESGEARQSMLVDPFNAKILEEDDCQQHLDANYGGQVLLSDEMLRASTSREILVRLLRNLKTIYAQAKLYRRTLAVIERILLVAPDAYEERRDLGAFLAQTGRYAEAAVEIKAYLKHAGDAPETESVREALKKVQMQLALLN